MGCLGRATCKVYLKSAPDQTRQDQTRPKNFLMGWLLVLGLKEGMVECATVCVKSWVILKRSQELIVLIYTSRRQKKVAKLFPCCRLKSFIIVTIHERRYLYAGRWCWGDPPPRLLHILFPCHIKLFNVLVMMS